MVVFLAMRLGIKVETTGPRGPLGRKGGFIMGLGLISLGMRLAASFSLPLPLLLYIKKI